MCVVDDLQWLDEPSLEALRFATRRLGAEGVAVLLSQRPVPGELVPGVETLQVAPAPRRPRAGAAATRAATSRCPSTSRGACSRPPPATRSRCARSRRCCRTTSSRDARRSRGRCRPARRSSACSRAASRRSSDDTRRALLVAAAAEVRRGDRRPAGAGGRRPRRRRARAGGVGRDRHARAGRRRVPPPAAAGRRLPRRHASSSAAPRTARSRTRCPTTIPSARGSWPPAARGRTSRSPPRSSAPPLDARARTGFAPAAHAHLRAAELSPSPVQRARRLVEAARDLLPAGYPEVGLARLEQAERVLAIAESGDVSAVAARPAHAAGAARPAHRPHRRGARDAARAGAAAAGRGAADGRDAAAALVARLDGAPRPRRLARRRRARARARRRRRAAGRARRAVGGSRAHDGPRRRRRAGAARGRRAAARRRPRDGALARAGDRRARRATAGCGSRSTSAASQLLDRLVAAGRESASVGALPYPLAARAQGNLYLGLYGRALADAEEAVALAEQTGQDPALVIALGMLATVHAWHGDAGAAHDAAAQALALAERRRVPLPAIYAHHALAMLAVASDRPEEAVERLELVRAEALPGNVLWAPHLVDAYVRAGRRDDAAALVEHYARSIDAPADRAGDARAHAGADRAAPTTAEAHFHAALELHDAGPGAVRARAHPARVRRVAARTGAPRRRARAAARRARGLRAGRGGAVRRTRPARAARGRRGDPGGARARRRR